MYYMMVNMNRYRACLGTQAQWRPFGLAMQKRWLLLDQCQGHSKYGTLKQQKVSWHCLRQVGLVQMFCREYVAVDIFLFWFFPNDDIKSRFWYNAVSRPKRFTFHFLVDLFSKIPFNHAQRLFIQISTTGYRQVLTQTAEWTGATREIRLARVSPRKHISMIHYFKNTYYSY